MRVIFRRSDRAVLGSSIIAAPGELLASTQQAHPEWDFDDVVELGVGPSEFALRERGIRHRYTVSLPSRYRSIDWAGSAIAGTAAHTAAGGTHDTSGALVGAGAVIAGTATRVAGQVFLGGHFGFDEKKKRRFEKDYEDEQERRKALQKAFGLLPEEEKVEVAAALTGEPEPVIDWAPFVIDHQKFLAALLKIEQAVKFAREESEVMELIGLDLL